MLPHSKHVSFPEKKIMDYMYVYIVIGFHFSPLYDYIRDL